MTRGLKHLASDLRVLVEMPAHPTFSDRCGNDHALFNSLEQPMLPPAVDRQVVQVITARPKKAHPPLVWHTILKLLRICHT